MLLCVARCTASPAAATSFALTDVRLVPIVSLFFTRRAVVLALVPTVTVVAVVGGVVAVRRRPAGVRTLSKSCTNRLAAATAVGDMPTCYDGAV
jgi:hypothetical protein